jgi:CHAD domain-containing protein
VSGAIPAADARVESLFRKLDRLTQQISSQAAPEAVHRFRTAVRRLESLIGAHAATEFRCIAKLAKQLTTLRRRAGKVRDLDVQLAALREVNLEAGRREKAVLTRHLTAVRGKRERKLRSRLQAEIDSGLRKRLRRGIEVLAGCRQVHSTKDFTAEALRRFQKLVEDYRPLTEENLHDFRTDCKRIRYLAEMSMVATPAAVKVVAALKRAQDAMGEWHDWFTLVEAAEEQLSKPASPFLAALRAYRRSAFQEALRVIGEANGELLNESAVLDTSHASPAMLPGTAEASMAAQSNSPKPAQNAFTPRAKGAAAAA